MIRNAALIVGTFLCLAAGSSSFAGYESSRWSDSHKFTYEVEGEIEVKPDVAVVPLIISVNSKSYSESLGQARQLLDGIKKGVAELGSSVFSATPSDFFKPQGGGRKLLDVSFFGGGDEQLQAALVFNIYVTFKPEHDFWQRAEFMAKANDFVVDLEKKHKKSDKIVISPREIYYEIHDVEKYRLEIVKSIYSKAHQMSSIVAEAEGVNLRVDEVTFDQRINKEVINFSRASLRINSRIEFSFEPSAQAAR